MWRNTSEFTVKKKKIVSVPVDHGKISTFCFGIKPTKIFSTNSSLHLKNNLPLYTLVQINGSVNQPCFHLLPLFGQLTLITGQTLANHMT